MPIFFLISGCLVSKSYERCTSLREYYRNRCLRIFPGLWICLLASLVVIHPLLPRDVSHGELYPE